MPLFVYKILLTLAWIALGSPLLLAETPQATLEKLHEHIHYNAEGPNNIGYIAIDQRDAEISQATWLYVKKALEYYRQTKPIFIIVHLNTPGGQVFAAQQIADALRDIDLKEHIPVVAYIDEWAISAGAMIAFGCRFIVAADNASMGAAEPIIMTSSGEPQQASEKVNSAIRVDFANRARIFGRNPDIAEAMVDKDIILVWRHGKVVHLSSPEQIRLNDPDADVVISAKGKLLTLTAQEMLLYGIADLVVPAASSTVTPEEYAQGHWPADKMGLWQAPFFKDIPNGAVDAYSMDWKTRFFVFLTTPIVSSGLFTAMLIAFYMEMSHPGFGIPGVIALTSLLLIVIATFSLEIAGWLEVIFLSSGLLFILLEFFAVPTGGLLAGVGALFFLAGFFGLLLPGLGQVNFEWQTGTFNAAGEDVLERLGWLCGAIVLAAISIAWLARYIAPRWYAGSRLILTGHEQDASAGYTAAGDTFMPPPGSRGVVTGALRPAGKVLIDDVPYQAMSDNFFIPEGTIVAVVRSEGTTLFVKAVSEEIDK